MYQISSPERVKSFVSGWYAADYLVSLWGVYDKTLFSRWVNILLNMNKGDAIQWGDILVDCK